MKYASLMDLISCTEINNIIGWTKSYSLLNSHHDVNLLDYSEFMILKVRILYSIRLLHCLYSFVDRFLFIDLFV